MAPRKRALAEADPNSILPPSKSSKGKGRVAEIIPPSSADAADESEWEDILDSPVIEAASYGEGQYALNVNPDCPPIETADGPKFLVIDRPYWDIQTELFEKEGEDDDDDGEDYDEEKMKEKFNIRASPNDLSEWPWLISKEAAEKYKRREKQAANRDQDAQGLYIYNDFSAYGMKEVIDNWVG